jgi:hypothetical protein
MSSRRPTIEVESFKLQFAFYPGPNQKDVNTKKILKCFSRNIINHL